MSHFASFLHQLFSSGEIALGGLDEPNAESIAEAMNVAREFVLRYRQTLPHEAPLLDEQAFQWAAINLYCGAQFIVHREVPAENVSVALGEPFPQPRTPSVQYSVDVIYRFLPDLNRFAKSASQDDPVCAAIETWSHDWPLSSVGMKKSQPYDPIRLTPNELEIMKHPALRQLYIDRMILEGDSSRMQVHEICSAVEASVGIHRQLAGRLFESVAIATAIASEEISIETNSLDQLSED